MIKAFIFDLDGVIVDTAGYHYVAWKALAKQLGFHFSNRENEKLKGVSREKSLEILLETGNIRLSEAEKTVLAEQKNTMYVGLISGMTPDEVLPGVVNFLKSSKMAGLKIGLGSASKNTPLILMRTALSEFFDAVVDGNSVTQAKPDPEVFLKGAELLGVQPCECVIFEDAKAGIDAAKKAGMKCIGVGDPRILNEADRVISGFEGLTASAIIQMF